MHTFTSEFKPRYRLRAMKLFMVKRGKGKQSDLEEAYFLALCNGDWRREGVIEHYCSGAGCCSSPQATRDKLKRWLPEFLFGVKAPKISQHRWTGLPF